jgi:integrase
MRISELLGLQWGDIDWDARIIHLNRTWVYGAMGEGKSEQSRQPVAMGNRMTELLREWHRETSYAEATDCVFPS